MKNAYIKETYEQVKNRNKNSPEFLQAVEEVLQSIEPLLDEYPEIIEHSILEKIVEPERMIQFQIPWVDDTGKTQINRGFRVQFNSAIGPYKGGIRFHPSVTSSIISFLGFEQTFKNALTGLPMGGAKGGSDFNPKEKSDGEIKRFCQSFMTELYRHIGQFTDVPAGDIGVGNREIGYLFGQYKRITNQFTGTLTGKDVISSGSFGRKQATGYGLIYIVEEMLRQVRKDSIKGKTVVISGSGNVAIYAAQKAIELGAKVVTVSDSSGYIYDKAGINLEVLKQVKEVERGRLTEYQKRVPTSTYQEGSSNVWNIPCDIALPCATQNEIDEATAKILVKNGAFVIAEGSNMSTTSSGVEIFLANKVLYLPGKAANAGGVAVSGLEMTQNSMRLQWSAREVDEKLLEIMKGIFENIYTTSKKYHMEENFVAGANIAGFLAVAKAMIWQG